MRDDVRKSVESGIRTVQSGLDALSKQAPEELSGLISRAEGLTKQLAGLAAGIVTWTSATRESVAREVRDVVSRQVKDMGLATKKDLAVLEERVAKLERPGRSSGGAAKSPAKRAKSTAGRKARAKKGAAPAGSSHAG